MPSGKCKGCGKMTNSAVSNWWLTKDHIPTQCFLAWDTSGKPERGCAYNEAANWVKKYVDKIIDNDVVVADEGEIEIGN